MSKATTNFQDLLKAIDQTDTDADLLAKGGDDEQDDAIIADASQSSESDNGEADEAGAVGKDKGKDMAKSLTAKDADGKDVEVVDATDMIKSLQDKIDSQESIMAKALTGLQSTLSKQNTLIKSLQDNIAKMSGEGRGRKAVLRAVDKPGAGETMAKSEGAAEDGKITMDAIP